MTEIPEHLLKRSRERRAAMGLGGDAPEGASTEAAATGDVPVPATPAATPAPAPAAAVEEVKPEPPKPDPAYVQAAKRRKRMPYWAASVLAALPLWGYVYVRTLEPPPAGEDDPLTLGADEYGANCASCHGGTGGGGAGAQLSDGVVIDNWPDWRDQAAWVRLGSENYPSATYGAEDKPTGGTGVMPGWTTLTDAQIAQVVLHERELSGGDVSEELEENVDLYAVARGEMTLVEAEVGELSEAAGVTEADLGG